jgi:Tfp pilus assembly protein PilF
MRTSTAALIALLSLPILPAAPAAQAPPPRSNPEVERAMLHYRLGWESLHAENWAAAVKEFQQAIDINKKFKLAYYGLGRSYMGLHQFQDATRAYETCRALYEAQASENFRNTLDADKMRQDDQRQLQIAIQQSSSKTNQTQQTQNQQQQLRTQLQRIQMKRDQSRDVSLDSTVPAFVSVALGTAYFRQERMPDAERAYKAALDDDPNAGEAHNNLAVLYMLTGRLDDSTKEVTLAEKAGFRVNPQFKQDLEAKRRGK